MRIVRSQRGYVKHLKAALVTHDRKRAVLAPMQFLAPSQRRYTVAKKNTHYTQGLHQTFHDETAETSAAWS